jgi:hypothetical protein
MLGVGTFLICIADPYAILYQTPGIRQGMHRYSNVFSKGKGDSVNNSMAISQVLNTSYGNNRKISKRNQNN